MRQLAFLIVTAGVAASPQLPRLHPYPDARQCGRPKRPGKPHHHSRRSIAQDDAHGPRQRRFHAA